MPLPIRPPGDTTIPPLDFERLTESARALDWASYLKLARSLGGLSPLPDPEAPCGDPREELRAMDRAMVGPLERELDSTRGAPAQARRFISSLLAFLDSEERSATLGWLLRRDAADLDEAWRGSLASVLMELGADPIASGAARAAAAVGHTEALLAMLEAGLDPNARLESECPLIFEALAHDRAYSMSNKMRAAQLLWDHGGRPSFHLAGGSPCCLLEWLALSLDGQPPAGTAWLEDFKLSLPYFEELERGVEPLLPEPYDPEGIARLGALLCASQPLGALNAARDRYPEIESACQAALAAAERLSLDLELARPVAASPKSL